MKSLPLLAGPGVDPDRAAATSGFGGQRGSTLAPTSVPTAPPSPARPLPTERDLFRYLWGMTGDVAVAEDLAQEARLVAWRQRHTLREPLKEAAWQLRIATNLARRHLRRQRRWQWLSWDHPDAAGLSHAEPEPSDRLRQALDSLDPDDRAVLLLLGQQDWTAQEVAEATGLTRDAVYKRWQRAYARFRERWEREQP